MVKLRGRLLFVDDDVDLVEVVRDQLRSQGFSLTWSESPLDALETLARPHGFDLVITDLRMPGLDGIEFVKRVKERDPRLPIILVTGHGSVETAVRAIRAGAYDFVMKPLNFAQLAVSAERALRMRRLELQNERLRQEVSGFAGVVGRHPRMEAVFDLARRVAASTASVLVTGESGTGKEVIARAIHQHGPRAKGPFIAINCSAIPDALLESELFGHARGAFTGATDRKLGLFEEAQGGTLFLDEIGDMPLALQAKLLRVLQERKIKRVGENQFRAIDVRILAATHKDLPTEVAAKRFREDLYYRLCVIPIAVPPLRERREDIPHLAHHFLEKFRAINGSRVQGFSRAALDRLLAYAWPGNVRELENAIERAVVLCQADRIEAGDLPAGPAPTPPAAAASAGFGEDCAGAAAEGASLPTLEEVSRRYVEFVLRRTGGVKERAARALGIDRKTLYRWLRAVPAGETRSEATLRAATDRAALEARPQP
jgi:DNA-binding NtrC family response regulator